MRLFDIFGSALCLGSAMVFAFRNDMPSATYMIVLAFWFDYSADQAKKKE